MSTIFTSIKLYARKIFKFNFLIFFLNLRILSKGGKNGTNKQRCMLQCQRLRLQRKGLQLQQDANRCFSWRWRMYAKRRTKTFLQKFCRQKQLKTIAKGQ